MAQAAAKNEKANTETTATKSRGLAKTQEGVVASNKMTKTVVVVVARHKKHANYGKYILKSQRYVAHDERAECKIGDRVRIVECRPLSKTKRWRVQTTLERAV